MNKELTRISEKKAIVSNTEGKQRVVEYYDNINEELVIENKIEILTKELTKLEKCKEDFEENKNNNYNLIMTITTSCAVISGILLILTLFGLNSLNDLLSNYIGNFDKTNLLIFETLTTSMGAIFTGITYKNKQADLDYSQKLNVKIYKTRESLIKERQKQTKELEKHSTRTQFTGLEKKEIPSFTVDEMLEATSIKKSGPKLIKTRNPNK